MAEPRKLDEFLAWKPEPLIPIVSDGVLYEGTKMLFYGRYKSMKSMMIKRLGLAVARGEPWLGFETTQGVVLYLQLEIPEKMLQLRVKKMTSDNDVGELFIWSDFTINIEDNADQVRKWLEIIQPSLFIIDPLYKFTKGNMLDQQSTSNFLKKLDAIIAEYPRMGTVIVSHSRKSTLEEKETISNDDALGSAMWMAWPDSILRVSKTNMREFDVSFNLRHAERDLDKRHFVLDPSDISFLYVPSINPEISLD